MRTPEGKNPGTSVLLFFYFRGQRAKYLCLHRYLATAARVKYPRTLVRCALQRCKLDISLLAARSLIDICPQNGVYSCALLASIENRKMRNVPFIKKVQ